MTVVVTAAGPGREGKGEGDTRVSLGGDEGGG